MNARHCRTRIEFKFGPAEYSNCGHVDETACNTPISSRRKCVSFAAVFFGTRGPSTGNPSLRVNTPMPSALKTLYRTDGKRNCRHNATIHSDDRGGFCRFQNETGILRTVFLYFRKTKYRRDHVLGRPTFVSSGRFPLRSARERRLSLYDPNRLMFSFFLFTGRIRRHALRQRIGSDEKSVFVRGPFGRNKKLPNGFPRMFLFGT